MGAASSNCLTCSSQKGPRTIQIKKSFFHLLQAGRSDDCIAVLRGQPDLKLSEPININEDTLLHYACGSHDYKVCQYILGKDPNTAKIKNKFGKLPQDLTDDLRIKALIALAVSQ